MPQSAVFTLPHAVQPLAVQAFGCRWLLTPSLEPLWTPSGVLTALELLTLPTDRDTGQLRPAEGFFAGLPQSELDRLLIWQLALLALLRPWCAHRLVPVTLNLTRPLATLLATRPELTNAAAALAPWLRLEVSEDFLPLGADIAADPLLSALLPVAPLWLDDFGAGATGLNWMLDGHFEAIKVDRRLFHELSGLHEGRSFLRSLASLALRRGVLMVAEGVSDGALMQAAADSGFFACQGWRWPAVAVSELNALPSRLPDAPRGRNFL